MFVSFWLSKADVVKLINGKELWITSYAMTESFLENFDVLANSEESEYTLTWLAGIFGLQKIRETGELGIIAVANLKPTAANWKEADDYGAVLARVTRNDISALFKLDLSPVQIPEDLSWGSEAVFKLISQTDLLWYDATELEILLNQL